MMKKTITFLVILFFINIFFVSAQTSWNGAHWISSNRSQSVSNTWLAYRKVVEFKERPVSALTKIAADSKYWLWINEKLVVFEGGLKRGPNPSDTYYDELDLAPYFTKGKNTIAILVWYFGKDGFSHQSSGRAGLLFSCSADGNVIVSNNSWKCLLHPAYLTASAPYPNFRLSESNILYDARFDPGKWQAADYDDRKIARAREIGIAGVSPWNTLVPRPIPLWKESGLKEYVKTTRVNSIGLGNDTLICELPYNAQITPYIRMIANDGQVLVMATDNYLFYNGSDNNIRAEYISRKGEQAYESLGWLNGHKVYYIFPKGLEILEVKYRESGYRTELSGKFNCSDVFFNQLWEKAQRTLYVNLRDSYMDCPDRERAQWTGDAVSMSGQSFYALSTSSHAMAKKWLYELLGWQKENGVLFSPMPAGNWDTELPDQSAASIGYYGLWSYYLHTGDKQTLVDLYGGAKQYLGIWEQEHNGLMKIRSGGWTWGDWGENKDMVLLFNLWYYLSVKGMYNISLTLGHTKDAAIYQEFMTKFKASFNSLYWNGKAYRNPSYKGLTDDRAQALAVISGVADSDKYSAILAVLKKETHASPYMEKYVFEAMFQMGYPDEALLRHKNRFAAMVSDPRFTTLFEGWGIGSQGYGGGTVNHAWGGGSLMVLPQYLSGITPIKPGFKSFRVFPNAGSIQEVSSVLETVSGTIRTEIKNLSDRFVLIVDVPNGTNAIAGIPNLGYQKVLLNKKVVWANGKYFNKDSITADHLSRITFDLIPGKSIITAFK